MGETCGIQRVARTLGERGWDEFPPLPIIHQVCCTLTSLLTSRPLYFQYSPSTALGHSTHASPLDSEMQGPNRDKSSLHVDLSLACCCERRGKL